MDDGRAVSRLGLVPLDQGVAVDLVADRRSNGPGTAAVDDADRPQAGERRVVDERADGLARLLRALPADVQLVADVTARRRHDAHRRAGLVDLLAVGAGVGPQALEREADPL